MTMTADHVARAIVASSRATGADPLMVASGHVSDSMAVRRLNNHARAYAAAALLRAFPSFPKIAVGRAVASKTPSVFVAQLEADMRAGVLRWWSDEKFAGVRAAVGEVVEREAEAPEAPPAPRWDDRVSRSAPPSKRALYDMLGDAVRNTGRASE